MAAILQKAQGFFLKCARVWAIMRKPTKEELKTTSKASGLGILLIGIVGFAIAIIMRFVFLKL